MITVDNRKCRRLDVLKSGLISFENSDDIHCNIINMSPFGACLELGNPVEVPEHFVLVVEADHIQWPCHIIWRSQTRIGVVFN
jgi:PilZ domain-containing protein